ncbi:MAG TPA: hypothetical protein VFH00_05235 [Candidatus Nitrosotalea sp.]|nr:hypothetical protein [Candidatus Nitrosotalea sp.]
MDQTALVVIGLAVLVIVLVLLLGHGGRRVHQARLVALSDESRNRYIVEWDRIEARFVDAPEEAVREADSVVMSMMRERRHPLEERRLPKEVRAARRDSTRSRGDRTEGMRRAMLQYRAVIEKMAGARSKDRDGRREMA